jgi:small conductance mechanosensitive channel
MKVSERIWAEVTKPEIWVHWAESAIRIFFVLVLAWVVSVVAQRFLTRMRSYAMRVTKRHGGGSNAEVERRATTITGALNKVLNFTIWIFALIMILTDMGFRIEPLLAGLGVAGVAIGLGANSLIKDWVGGLFILLEDQARIGDAVTINGTTSGAVEEINLRTTILRGEDGGVHIISNGSITKLSNFSREYSYFVFETVLAHGADADRALKIVEATAAGLQQEIPYKDMILAPIEMFGIDRLSDRGVTIKARIKTLPGKNGDVGHELNRRVRLKLIEEKIAFPAYLPQI